MLHKIPAVSGLWLVKQFLCIFRQTVDQIELRFGGPINYGLPQAWLTFGQTPLNFYLPFPGLCLVENFHAFADKPLIRFGSYIVGLAHYGPSSVWLNIVHALLNSCHFLASDWSSSFHTFTDKALIGLTSKLVGQLWLPSCSLAFGPPPLNFCLFLPSNSSSSFHAFSDKLLIRLGSNLVGQPIKASPVWLLYVMSSFIEFPLFNGLWLVDQFLCIWKQTIEQIELKFAAPTHYELPQAWLTYGHAPLNPSSNSLPLWFNSQWGSSTNAMFSLNWLTYFIYGLQIFREDLFLWWHFQQYFL